MIGTGPSRFDTPPPGRRPPTNLRAVAMRRKELEAELEQARQAARQSKRAANKQWFMEPLHGEREDGWLITYLDMMTLLLVLMLVMLAFAGKGLFDGTEPVEATGIELVQRGLTTAGGSDDGSPSEAAAIVKEEPVPLAQPQQDLLQGAIDGMSVELNQWFEDLDVPDPLYAFSIAPTQTAGVHEDTVTPTSPGNDPVDAAGAQTPSPAADIPLEESAKKLLEGLPLDQLGEDIDVIITERAIAFRINSEILFSSGKADLSRAGLAVLQRLVPVLNQVEHQITVEGHTDSVPIRSSRYPSNWELSGSRAGSVVRYLEANGISSGRLRAIGYADTRALGDNETEDGRAVNRRVELIVERREDAGTENAEAKGRANSLPGPETTLAAD